MRGKKANRKLFFQIKCILVICLWAGALFGLPSSGYGADFTERTVRVAYFDLGSYYQERGDGNIDSYDSAYLAMITQYTGIQFEYVNCGTWNQALQKLENHEIDLVGTMQWTKEREEQYEICDTSYGYTVAELATLPNSPFIYEDYEGINGATVGFMEGYVVQQKLQELMEEKDLTLDLKPYKTQQELDLALENREIDMVAANSHAIHNDWKIIEKFAYAPFYFASWKGNDELTRTISETIIQINLHQADFDDKLIEEYFPVMVNSPYNKEEMVCIAKKKTYTVYFDTDTEPIVWYDRKSDSMQGVLVDICDQLAATTGLQFNIRPNKEKTDIGKVNAVTYRTLYYENGGSASLEEGVTESIIDQKFEMYHRVGASYETDGAYTIAIVKNRDGMKAYLEKQYPNSQIVECDSPKNCIDQVVKSQVDLAFVNTHIADNIIITNNLNEVTTVPMTEMTFGIALQFHGEDAQLLSGIVDKGIKLLDEDAINEAMLQYAMNTAPKMTMSYIVQQHTGMFTVWILILIVISSLCLSLLVYARIMKKERNRMAEINRERTDFFARMSHDMRTPMNGILGMLELTDQTSDLAVIRENTKKAMLSGNYMLSLINDTLDLQRLESKKLTLEPQVVYVKDFIDNIKEMIKPSAEQKQIHFEWDNVNIQEESFIHIDQMRVKQIFVNILSNAVKFTQEFGTIRTSMECLMRRENEAQIKVEISDTGIGMSSEFMDKNLFKPYSQELNKVTNRYAGSGLGLAIVKNLVELMGGQIQVKSELGEGTTFTIELTFEVMDENVAKENRQITGSSQEEIRARLSGKNILICEDHPLNAEIAQRLLEAVGCHATIAQDGKQGVEAFLQSELHSFDVILMDIRMPVMDGLEAAAAIRAQEREDAKTIPIIAMTANAYDSDKENCVKAGMNTHLSKPIDVNELYHTLEQYVGSVR